MCVREKRERERERGGGSIFKATGKDGGSPYDCEPSVHLIGKTDVNEPPTISAGRFATSLKITVPFALKIPRTPSICWAKRRVDGGGRRERGRARARVCA